LVPTDCTNTGRRFRPVYYDSAGAYAQAQPVQLEGGALPASLGPIIWRPPE
jgi:hypothetical protein